MTSVVQMKTMVDQMPGGIGLYEAGPPHRALYHNAAFFDIFGCTQDEYADAVEHDPATGNAPDALLYPEDRWIWEDVFRLVGEKGIAKGCVYRVICKDGSLRWVQTDASRMEADGAPLIFASFLDITSVREIESDRACTEALRQNQQLKLALRTANMSTWEYDAVTRRIYQDDSSQLQHGFGRMVEDVPESLIAGGFVHPDCVDDYRKLYAPMRPGEGVRQGDFYVRTADRKDYWWERIILTPVFDAAGRHVLSIGITLDVTEQKSLEAKYMQQKQIFDSARSANLIAKGLYNLSRDCVDYYYGEAGEAVQLDARHDYADGVEGAAATFAYSEEADKFRARFDRLALLRQFDRGTSEVDFAYQRVCEDGRIIWAQIFGKLYREPVSNDVMCFVYSYDIHEQKTAQDMIRTVVRIDYDYLALLDCRTHDYVVYTSQKESHTPLPPFHSSDYEHEVAEYAHAYVAPDDIERNIHDMSIDNIQTQLKERDLFVAYVAIREDDGSTSHKKLQFSYLDRSNEKVLITRIDVTDVYLREQEQSHELEEANRAKNDFLSHMSHDLRTPMNAIIGLSELARYDLNDPAAMKDYIDDIRSAAQFLLGLVSDCLDFEKLSAHKVELHEVPYPYQEFQDNITMMIGPLCQQKHLELVFQSSTSCTVCVDKVRFEQIFFNLLSNAVKYTPEGGTVGFFVDGHLDEEQGLVRCDFTIRDNGIGMSEEFQTHLFMPFEQESADVAATQQGTGLGLSIVRELVELMGGTIHVSSCQGEGTEVRVHLDMHYVSDGEDVRPTDQLTYHEGHLRGRSILLLEDQPLNMMIAQKLLEKQGMTVTCAENGVVGLERFMQSSEGTFDAILTDIRMPKMDGLEVARSIRALERPDARSVPIIAMTANAFAEDVRESERVGMNAHLSKPIEPLLLYQTLERLIPWVPDGAAPVT